jgi:hypothetical protein
VWFEAWYGRRRSEVGVYRGSIVVGEERTESLAWWAAQDGRNASDQAFLRVRTVGAHASTAAPDRQGLRTMAPLRLARRRWEKRRSYRIWN